MLISERILEGSSVFFEALFGEAVIIQTSILHSFYTEKVREFGRPVNLGAGGKNDVAVSTAVVRVVDVFKNLSGADFYSSIIKIAVSPH